MSSSVEQLIASAYVFGAGALAFATLPFLFCILRALMKAKEPHTLAGGIFGVFLFAFAVHLVSCVAFVGVIKVLDLQTIHGANYYSEKVFGVFWTEGKSSVISLAKQITGASSTTNTDNSIAEGSYTILYTVQTIRDWFFILLPPTILCLGVFYGAYMAKKDTYKQSGDYLTTAFWTIGSSVIASFLFILWAKIASYALFMNEDIIYRIAQLWNNIINGNSAQ